MPICIKNRRVEDLARELASVQHESLTEAIRHALEDRLERTKGTRSETPLSERIRAIGKRCAALPDRDRRTPDAILGYGKHGSSLL